MVMMAGSAKLKIAGNAKHILALQHRITDSDDDDEPLERGANMTAT